MNLEMNNQNKSTFVNLLTGIATMFIQLLVNFYLSSFIVKNIGEAANGFTQLANNFVSYATLITIAFNSMAGRFIAVYFHKGLEKKVNLYYTAVITCNVVMILLLIPISIFVIYNLKDIIVIGDSNYLDVQLLFSCVFLNYFLNLISSIYCISFYVLNKIYVQNLFNLLRNIANAVLLLVIFSILPAKMYYVSLVTCILSLILMPLFIMCKQKYMPLMKYDKSQFRISIVIELFKSGIWNTVNQCGHMLMTGLDLLLANLFIDPISMGVLAISKTIPTAIIQLASVLNNSFAPSLTIDWAKGNDKEVVKQLKQSMRVSSVFLSIPIITFSIFSIQFYQLWMPSISSKSLAILSFFTVMPFIPWAGPQILYNVFTTANKLKANSLSFLLTGILNFIIVWILLQYTSLGIYAIAGVSSLLSILRNLVFTAPYVASILKLKWNSFYIDVLFSIICSVVNAIIGISLKLLLGLQGWYGLLLMVIITCILTFITDLFLILNKKERLTVIKKILKKQ